MDLLFIEVDSEMFCKKKRIKFVFFPFTCFVVFVLPVLDMCFHCCNLQLHALFFKMKRNPFITHGMMFILQNKVGELEESN